MRNVIALMSGVKGAPAVFSEDFNGITLNMSVWNAANVNHGVVSGNKLALLYTGGLTITLNTIQTFSFPSGGWFSFKREAHTANAGIFVGLRYAVGTPALQFACSDPNDNGSSWSNTADGLYANYLQFSVPFVSGWFKLIRTGNTIFWQNSPDGITYTTRDSRAITASILNQTGYKFFIERDSNGAACNPTISEIRSNLIS